MTVPTDKEKRQVTDQEKTLATPIPTQEWNPFRQFSDEGAWMADNI